MEDIVTAFCEMLKKNSRNGLRIGQMISALFDKVAATGKDPFFVSDEELLGLMRAYTNGEGPFSVDDKNRCI